MKAKSVLMSLTVVAVLLAVAVISVVLLIPASHSPTDTGARLSPPEGVPSGVTLRQIDGGPHYYAHIDPG